MPDGPAPPHWRWVALTDIARLESGHTPSRRHPEWWGGDIPWLSIRDARDHHGRRIDHTAEHTNKLGLENSSARLLPADTVCLSRTASVGYVVVTGRPMATSQDFVNWICSDQLLPQFLQYLLVAEGEDLLRFASGSVHQTIYFPEVKAFHVCLPSVKEQRRIVALLDEAFDAIAAAKANAEKNADNARAVFEGHLHSVFSRSGASWQIKTIDEVAEHSLGKMLDKTKNRGVLQPYLRNFNVRWFGFDLSDVSEMRFLPEESARYSAIPGDVLVCEGGYPGRAAIWEGPAPIYFQKALHRVRFKQPDLNNWFIYYLWAKDRSGELREHFSGTGIQHFTGEALARFSMPIPLGPELHSLVTRFDVLSTECKALASIYERKLAVLDELKRTILHQAFTGQF